MILITSHRAFCNLSAHLPNISFPLVLDHPEWLCMDKTSEPFKMHLPEFTEKSMSRECAGFWISELVGFVVFLFFSFLPLFYVDWLSARFWVSIFSACCSRAVRIQLTETCNGRAISFTWSQRERAEKVEALLGKRCSWRKESDVWIIPGLQHCQYGWNVALSGLLQQSYKGCGWGRQIWVCPGSHRHWTPRAQLIFPR